MPRKRTIFIGALLAGMAIPLLVALSIWLFAPYIWKLPFTGPHSGVVTDADTGRPIPGAKVVFSWWLHDNPLPDGPGHHFAETVSQTDEQGAYTITKLRRRGGLFGTHQDFHVSAPGYIGAAYLVDSQPLPPSTVAWPFVDTTALAVMPKVLNVKLKPARPVYLKHLDSPNPLYRDTAKEELEKLDRLEKAADSKSDPGP